MSLFLKSMKSQYILIGLIFVLILISGCGKDQERIKCNVDADCVWDHYTGTVVNRATFESYVVVPAVIRSQPENTEIKCVNKECKLIPI